MSGHLQWRPTGSDLGWVVIYNRVLLRNWNKEPKSDFSGLGSPWRLPRHRHRFGNVPGATPDLWGRRGDRFRPSRSRERIFSFENERGQ